MHRPVLILWIISRRGTRVVIPIPIPLAQLRRDAFPQRDEDVEDIHRGQNGADAENPAVVVLRLGTEVGGRDVADLVGHPGVGVQEEGRHEGDFAREEDGGDGVGEVVESEVGVGVEVAAGFEEVEYELGEECQRGSAWRDGGILTVWRKLRNTSPLRQMNCLRAPCGLTTVDVRL